jgi:methyl-galactoside transport system substrate-binding protein
MILGDPDDEKDAIINENMQRTLIERGVVFTELSREYAKWDLDIAQRLTADIIERYAGEIDMLICVNDYYTPRVYQTIVESGRVIDEDIYLVGCGANDESEGLVDECAITGTVVIAYGEVARAETDAAVRFASGLGNETFIRVSCFRPFVNQYLASDQS